MSKALVSFIVILILLLLILVYLLKMSNDHKKKSKNKTQQSNNSFEIVNSNNIKFPKNIERMKFDALSKSTKTIFDSYKALDYIKSASSLDKIEWHTWQVSILLRYLESKNKIFISYDNLFHTMIENLSETQIELELQKIYKKYIENVNIEKTRDDLSNDIIWSAREVSIILYKIINNK